MPSSCLTVKPKMKMRKEMGEGKKKEKNRADLVEGREIQRESPEMLSRSGGVRCVHHEEERKKHWCKELERKKEREKEAVERKQK